LSYESVFALLRGIAEKHGDGTAYLHKQDGAWVETSWTQTTAAVDRVALALLGLGLEKGERVSILGGTRIEWVLADFGIVCAGGVTVGIYHSNLAVDCGYIAEHSDSVLCFVENDEQLDKMQAMREGLPLLRQLVRFDGASDPSRNILSWEDFLAHADGIPRERLDERGASLRGDDLASLVYTSGTTGVPKGAMISHRNLLFASASAGQCLELKSHYRTLLFLPLAHVFARLAVHFCMGSGVAIAFAEDVTRIGENLKEIRPHFIASVPRVYEKIYDRIVHAADSAGGLKRSLFHWAVGVGRQEASLRSEGRSMPPWLRLKHRVAHQLVFAKIQAALGGRMEFAVSGAAPLNPTIGEFFDACGVPIIEGLGMTENTSFSNVNPLRKNKFGTVGPGGPGIEIKIADDGEVLFRGDNVMVGYFKDPKGTAEAIDAEGWLHSGDIGELDADGYLTITDRKKDLIVTAGGKNIAPQRIERILRTSPFIAHAMAVGDRRKFVTALLTLEAQTMRQWCQTNGVEGADTQAWSTDEKVLQLLGDEVHRLNGQLASFETVKRFHIAPLDFSIEGGELTPTLKIKRKAVFEKYCEELDALYP